MEKAARIINGLGRGRERSLARRRLRASHLGAPPAAEYQYYGIDISIPEPAPNLIEADLLASPIGFDDKRFDIVLAQGFFEYMGEFQRQKFAEIAELLNPGGTFVLTYVNFGHRDKEMYWPYNNVQPLGHFREDLHALFHDRKILPDLAQLEAFRAQPQALKAVNMHINANIP